MGIVNGVVSTRSAMPSVACFFIPIKHLWVWFHRDQTAILLRDEYEALAVRWNGTELLYSGFLAVVS